MSSIKQAIHIMGICIMNDIGVCLRTCQFSFPLSFFPLFSFSLCLKRQGILKVGNIMIFSFWIAVVIPKLPPITLFVGKLHLK